MKQHAVIHSEIGTAFDDFRFQFELDDADGFMHLSNHAQGLFVVRAFLTFYFGTEQAARVFSISFHGKGCQRQKIDTVSVFKYGQVTIAHCQSEHVSHATFVSGCSSHP